MKKKITQLLTCLAAATALFLSSCKDDELFIAEVEYPQETVDNVLTVDAWASEFPIEIKAESEWKIEKDSRFFRVSPESGTGNGTVTVYVQDNQGEERKDGTLSIIFPSHEDKNKELIIEQKCKSDYGEDFAANIGTSNKVYAIGYSYDATGEWASPNSVKIEIFDTKLLSEEGKHVVGPTQASLVENIITGSSISEMTNALAVKADVKGGFGKFKAEASASFDMNHAKNTNFEYATTYFNLDVRTASFDTDLMTLAEDYMTDDAWYAINGVPRENKRTHKKKVSYPSTTEGFKNLVEYYGTHVILSANLGGRVRYSMEADISKISSSFDIKAFAKASYEGAFVSASGSVDEKFKQSYKDNKQHVTIRLNVLGGDESKAKRLGASDGFKKSNLEDWVQSVTADNMALVGFNKGSLVPLYELIDESLTEEEEGVDGKARKEALKRYLEGGMGNDPDFSTYDCGTVTEFDINDINFSNAGSLVRDIVLDGQYVGQICNEYIPNINRDARVTVVYPVINNVPRYNMGFFLGNNSHKPARICWDGTNVAVEEYADLDFGAVSRLYLRGASVSAVLSDGTTTKRGSVKDSYCEAFGKSYRLVKIFNHVWLGEDWQATKKSDGTSLTPGNGIIEHENRYYYWGRILGKDIKMPPSGWRFPKTDDYNAIKSKLSANGINEIGKAFKRGGVLGFDITNWQTYDRGWQDSYVEYITSTYLDEYNGCLVRISKDGGFDITDAVRQYSSIRFIKE
ncbi:MAG: hypothetical protein J6J53_05665 [Muribaculaceae bacterium]|nr:hypothetical protein [Muribaculaceae bacterium]